MINFFNSEIPSNNNIALLSSRERISYLELNQRVQQTAYALFHNHNISVETHTAILSENNIDYIIFLLALWKLKAVPIPLNIRLLDNELNELISHSGSEYIFISTRMSDRLSNLKNKVLFPFTVSGTALLPSQEINDSSGEALIMYTSGMTGLPKGVVLNSDNLIESAIATTDYLEQSSKDRWLASLPFYHIGGLQIIIRALLKGSTIILPDSLGIESIIDSIKSFEPAFASFVPTTLKRLIDLKIKPNPEMKYVLLGGGPTDSKLIEAASELNWNIIKVYGSTETSSNVTALKTSEHKQKIDSAGKVIGKTRIQIVDNSGNPLPPFSIGEITITGSTVFNSYWNNLKETNTKLINDYYYSGDIGYCDNEGYLYIEARRTDLIISGGENINPYEIENVILQHPDVEDVCVFPLTNNEWGQIPAAAMVTKNVGLTEYIIKEFLSGKISSYKIPKKYFFIESLPRNELGKINREKVRKIFVEKKG